ncbi:MAG: TraR/DksA C4-type zinc finger protein [Chitinophagales bacterium]
MNKDFIENVKTTLLGERQRLVDGIQRKRDAAEKGIAEMTDELSMYDQHPGDQGSELFEREKDAGLLLMQEDRLYQIDQALHRIETGEYGICQFCGLPINPERLKRLPSATLCISCAQRTTDKYTRPAEEKVLSMSEINEKGDQFEVAGYSLYDE